MSRGDGGSPKRVRNFWVNCHIDGRARAMASGPARKDGGFEILISIRSNGMVARDAVRIRGVCNTNGTLSVLADKMDQKLRGSGNLTVYSLR